MLCRTQIFYHLFTHFVSRSSARQYNPACRREQTRLCENARYVPQLFFQRFFYILHRFEHTSGIRHINRYIKIPVSVHAFYDLRKFARRAFKNAAAESPCSASSYASFDIDAILSRSPFHSLITSLNISSGHARPYFSKI